MRHGPLAICGILLALPALAAQGVITTVAGSQYVFRGDGQPALSIPIGRVSVHVDPAGNIIAGAFEDSLLYRINSAGILSVIAGNGIFGFSGDGGPAVNASLTVVRCAVSDSAGNLYIADSYNFRVRKITPSGIISTVAGSGVLEEGGDGGPALSAGLHYVNAIALDGAGNLLIAGRNRVRRVNLSTGVITTIAGGGTADPGDGGPATAALLGPRWVTVDAAGNILITETERHRIRRVSPQGVITTVAGTGTSGFSGDGGPAASARLSGPTSAVPDLAGGFFISDDVNERVRQVNAQGVITTVAGSGLEGFGGDGGPAIAAAFTGLRALAVDSAGAVYVPDTDAFRIRKFTPGGTINTVAGNGQYRFGGDGGQATSALLGTPLAAIGDAAGNLYISDANNNRIRKVDPAGIISTIAGTGAAAYSGDNGPATAAALQLPTDLALDSAGNLYVADTLNNRVRRITPAGVITTVAGIGTVGLGAENIPATSSPLVFPSGLAFDAGGNLYISEYGARRVRRMTPADVISTYAGNGSMPAGFSGDGGPATSAQLAGPEGLAFDAAGNLYIADSLNLRIRRVSPTGVITTFAGNGALDSSTRTLCPAAVDGGAATAASLCRPVSVAVDAAGNLYIADSRNNRIRRVSGGVITTVAGDGFIDPITGIGRFAGEGVPATSASLNVASGVSLDPAGNLLIADTNNERVRKVLVARPSISVSPASLTFSGADDSAALPAQSFSVTSATLGLGWTASAATSSGGNWLTVNPATGSVPGAISVTPDVTGLAPGTYQGTVTVQAPLATPSVQTATVTLTVTAAAAASLTLDPANLSFTAQASASNPAAQTLRVGTSGRGALNWTASAATTSGGDWLGLSPAQGSTTAAGPAAIQVQVNTSGLPTGVYTGTIQVSSSGPSVTAGVTLVLSRPTPTILVSQTALLFTGVQGGASVPSQTVGVLNVGQGTMDWTAEAVTLSGGNWLSVTPASGTSVADSLQIPSVEVLVDVSNLAPGQYSGLIRVRASGADNSPQGVTVDLNVLPRGSNPGVLVRPTGLIFATQAGTSSPSSQTTRLATPVPGVVDVRGGLLTFDGANWLDASPRAFRVSPADPRTLIIQPSLGTLAPGVYRGAVTLLFADASPSQVVNVLFVVVPQAAAANGVAAPCVPQKLLAVMRSLGSSFSSAVGWPTTLEVQVADDCGNAIPRATVVASFSNGDPPLTLASLGNGVYTASWRPLNTGSQVNLAIRALSPPLSDAQLQVQGVVRDNPNPAAPAVFPGGIVNAASFAKDGAVAPGSIISVFGRNMSTGQGGAASLPLPTNLAGATLSIAGADVPLFYSSTGQINAQLPYELAANARQQVVVKAADFLTVPETVTVAEARPGIFTTNQQGTGQGAILNASGALADASGAVPVGGVVQIFATGLGMTNPAVPSGQPAPGAEPLARVAAPVTVRIGGQDAEVQFAGLAPGFVGLYQVNAVVPAGTAPGSAVSVVIVQNGVASNTATAAVR
jgi:uncharacterized protein (TIGR03437 family)